MSTSERIAVSAILLSRTKLQVTSKLVCVGEGTWTVAAWQAALCELYNKKHVHETLDIISICTVGGAEVDVDHLLEDIVGKQEEPELVVVVADAALHLQPWQLIPLYTQAASNCSSLDLSPSTVSTPTLTNARNFDGLSAKTRSDLLRDGRNVSSPHVPEGSIAKLRKNPLSTEAVFLIRRDIDQAQQLLSSQASPFRQGKKRKRESESGLSPSTQQSHADNHATIDDQSATFSKGVASPEYLSQLEKQNPRRIVELVVKNAAAARSGSFKAVAPSRLSCCPMEEPVTEDRLAHQVQHTRQSARTPILPVSTSSQQVSKEDNQLEATLTTEKAQAGHLRAESSNKTGNTSDDDITDDANTDELNDFMSTDEEDQERYFQQRNEVQSIAATQGQPMQKEPLRHVAPVQKKSLDTTTYPACDRSGNPSEDSGKPSPITDQEGQQEDAESMASASVESDESTASSDTEVRTHPLGIMKQESFDEDSEESRLKEAASLIGTQDSRQRQDQFTQLNDLSMSPSNSQTALYSRRQRPSLATRPFKSLSFLVNQPQREKENLLRHGGSLPGSAHSSHPPSALTSPLRVPPRAELSEAESCSDDGDASSSSGTAESDAALPTSKMASAKPSSSGIRSARKRSRGVRGLLD